MLHHYFLISPERCHAHHTNLGRDFLATACRLTCIIDRSPLISESLEAITVRESARWLALLGGSTPELN